MIEPKIHSQESSRLKELDSYSILDTLSEKDYDNLTAIASEICGTPISLVSLIDDKRQWFKSHHGLDATETPKEYAFCAHAINEPNDVFIVNDARKDERFHDNPLVTDNPNVIFYAGVPLLSDNGLPLGTLCVIDNKPKELTQNQINSLDALSKQVMNLMKLRRTKFQLETTLDELEVKNFELERFAYTAAHDIKSPLSNISRLAKDLQNQYQTSIDEDGQQSLGFINKAAGQLKSLVDGLLDYSLNENILQEEVHEVSIPTFRQELTNLFPDVENCSLTVNATPDSIVVNKTAITQIITNLVSNAIKYNDKPETQILIEISENETEYSFSIRDNGPGIAENFHKKIFQLFEITTRQDKYGNKGNGIGLATVKKLVEKLGGTISVSSQIGEWTEFNFSIPKAVEFSN